MYKVGIDNESEPWKSIASPVYVSTSNRTSRPRRRSVKNKVEKGSTGDLGLWIPLDNLWGHVRLDRSYYSSKLCPSHTVEECLYTFNFLRIPTESFV